MAGRICITCTLIVVILVSYAVQIEGRERQCWIGLTGPEGFADKGYCRGSCYLTDSYGDYIRGCYSDKMPSGSRHVDGRQYFFCNYDFCN